MEEITDLTINSFRLIFDVNSDLFEIVFLSLKISIFALFFACLLGLPIALLCVVNNFRGKKFVLLFFNSLMGLPPVLVGLILYIFFSSTGPLGFFQILYTTKIMVLAQIILVLPIIISLSFDVLNKIYNEYDEMMCSLSIKKNQKMYTILWDGRFFLFTSILAGLGRALSEVGAIIIVGGNIASHTRTMTTTIALETSKGNLEFAVGLGIILVVISIFLNLSVYSLRFFSKKYYD